MRKLVLMLIVVLGAAVSMGTGAMALHHADGGPGVSAAATMAHDCPDCADGMGGADYGRCADGMMCGASAVLPVAPVLAQPVARADLIVLAPPARLTGLVRTLDPPPPLL